MLRRRRMQGKEQCRRALKAPRPGGRTWAGKAAALSMFDVPVPIKLIELVFYNILDSNYTVVSSANLIFANWSHNPGDAIR